MLSRRNFRVKTMQALYAFFQSGNDRLDLAEKELFRSIDKIHELYITQLSFFIAFHEFCKVRMEDAKLKFLPTEDDLEPNLRFIENTLLMQLAENKDLGKWIDSYKISWAEETELIRKLYKKTRESQDYIDYMAAETMDYEGHKEFLLKLFKKHIAKSKDLSFIYEEKSIYWVDDLVMVNLMVLKTLLGFSENTSAGDALPGLYGDKSAKEVEDDRKFIRDLFRKTILHSDEYEAMIKEKVQNWELERVASMDVLLLKMALAELTTFPSIPVKVSMDEYIEMSKNYSSPKSKVFINGVLDRLVAELKEGKKIAKKGRGLKE